MFITFEGIDGCGKTTTIKKVVESLINLHYTVHLSKEPIGDAIGEMLQVECQPLTQLYLFLADRVEHVALLQKIKHKYDFLISDRYADSTIAYQMYGNNIVDMWNIFKDIPEAITLGLVPDLTFYLKIDLAQARERVKERKEKLSFFEKQGDDFYRRVMGGYEHMAYYNPTRIVTIEVENKSIVTIAKECLTHILKRK